MMLKQTPFTALLLALALAGAGCRKEEIRVYRVPKEKPPQEFAAANPHSTGARLRLGFKVPAGWTEEESGQMRAASFSIEGAEGQHAEVAAIPIPGMKRADVEFVNLWRQQVQLEPVTADALPQMVSGTPIGDIQGQLFDVMAGEPESGAAQTNRIHDPREVSARRRRRQGGGDGEFFLRPGGWIERKHQPLARPAWPRACGGDGFAQPGQPA
ncbi:MAG: hypothetical protein HY300_09405 [Verrucomicrobia bacterium]|nr:hypothetical protein [Verrucomicrobiota bacterium]